jgi:hypothetical protein
MRIKVAGPSALVPIARALVGLDQMYDRMGSRIQPQIGHVKAHFKAGKLCLS